MVTKEENCDSCYDVKGQESYQPGLTPVNLSECRGGSGRGKEKCGVREGRGEEREKIQSNFHNVKAD